MLELRRGRRGRVLLVYRTDCDWWCQPGGGMESGETPWDGVIRETREETGFEVGVERLAGVYSWAPRKDEVIFSFVYSLVGGERATSDESDDVRFFVPEELPTNTFPEHIHRTSMMYWRASGESLLKRAEEPSSHDVARGEAVPHEAP